MAGYATSDPDIGTALVDLVRHSWERRRGLLFDERPRAAPQPPCPGTWTAPRVGLFRSLPVIPSTSGPGPCSGPDGRVLAAGRWLRPEACQDDDDPCDFFAHTAVRSCDQRNPAGELNVERTASHRSLRGTEVEESYLEIQPSRSGAMRTRSRGRH